MGLFGQDFTVYKFRSMRTDAEKNGAVWAMKSDPRVTKVGKIIRKTRIDELPQLWNPSVIKMGIFDRQKYDFFLFIAFPLTPERGVW